MHVERGAHIGLSQRTDGDWLEFASAWCTAWNAHDVEAVLSHFHEDAVFSSPAAKTIVPDSGGILRGRAAIADYWRRGIEMIPNLHFRIERVFVGVDIVTIQYSNQNNVTVNEVLLFEGPLVRRGFGVYPLRAAGI